MKSGDINRKRIYLVGGLIIAAAFIVAVRDNVFRDLWFDESLTVTNFMLLPKISMIYRQYVIPNNQIVYTFLLRLWEELRIGGFSPDQFWRLFSVICAGGSVAIMMQRWRKSVSFAALPVLLALLIASAFAIYATAVRGYMLSFLFILIAIELARGMIFRFNWKYVLGYFICCLLTLGTIPTNLLPLGAVVLYFFPYFGFKKILDKRFLILALLPIAALLLFYLPLLPQVVKIVKLREGWGDQIRAAIVTYSGFILPMLPVVVAAITGGIIWFRKTSKHIFCWRLVIIILPLLVIFARNPAPFPRVFFTMWPLWLLLTADGCRHLLPFLRKKRYTMAAVVGLCLITALWGKVVNDQKEFISQKLYNCRLDDYFSPYYMRADYTPWNTVLKLQRMFEETGVNRQVYLTFNSDPYSFLLYGRFAGMPTETWLFDNPLGKVNNLPSNALIVISKRDNPSSTLESLKECFGLKQAPAELFKSGTFSVYSVK
ncbi:MAG: hypothetical protein GY750_02425 [Lentisphaerae bacterium]|nr:hypothetical protein [Lentisphaerota bacterium]MCP4100277.1 hypothetical protein [Lentisphaerota bacterium]